MPTQKERTYYRMGYTDGLADARRDITRDFGLEHLGARGPTGRHYREYEEQYTTRKQRPTRKLSAWQKFVKTNSKKPRFRYKSGAKKGRVNLKALGVAYRKKRR